MAGVCCRLTSARKLNPSHAAPASLPAAKLRGLGHESMAAASRNLPSPFSPLPSPASPTSPSASPSPPWAFPFGPSTRFTRRERATSSQHTRFKSTYTPTAPSLRTETRAHRRTQSSAHVAASAVLTPPASELSRSPLSRFPSYTSSDMAPASMMAPITPAKGHGRYLDSAALQDSPFSDYFTDDARSVDHGALPSTETQQLLVRLNKLQSHVMRSGEGDRDVLNIVRRRMSEIDLELDALHSQTRQPLDLEDSGLFMDEDEEEEDEAKHHTPLGQSSPATNPFGLDGAMDFPDVVPSPEQKKAEHDYLLSQWQLVLTNVTKAQNELRQRLQEVQDVNNAHMQHIEDKEQQLEHLRSESEALKSDLGFDHSELLFLKLQMKALEVEVDSLDDDIGDDSEAIELMQERKRAKRGRILQEMDRWRHDWQDVDGRFKRRRSCYGVLSADERDHTLAKELDADEAEEEEEKWQLETVKSGCGKVSSITIRRHLPGQPALDTSFDGTADERESDLTPVVSQAKYLDRGSQTEMRLPFGETDADEESAQEYDGDDCAITTSSSSIPSPILSPLEAWQGSSSAKTALQMLWDDLSDWAGVGER